ncbi:(deoxy)nucleoside triphosphate pyrophosphohydrolase [Novosphingobium sp. M1R2S20]|uniref:8-oxo-dGTP diphosphatase n=1 Tax=Novosphingobium rhizovicinum TaxID=3228928 RepID=A0ABV3R9R4_9SPHN
MSNVHECSGPLWVAAVALIDAAGQVLMQKRPAEAAHGGLWEFPGGKLEQGESPEAAAVREIAEELGVILDPSDLQPAVFASGSTEAASRRPLVILLFACSRWKGVPAAEGGASIAWSDPADISKLPMPPLDYPLAEGLLRLLHANAF